MTASFPAMASSAIRFRSDPNQDIALQINKLLCHKIQSFESAPASTGPKTVLENEVALGVTDIFEASSKRRKVGLRLGTFRLPEHANASSLLRLLCSGGQRPSSRRPHKANELASPHLHPLADRSAILMLSAFFGSCHVRPHSITLVARANMIGG